MPARLSVHRLDASAPESIVRQALEPWLGALPVGRDVLVGVVGWTPTPGLAVSPWVLEGLVGACEEARLDWSWTFLGPAPSAGRLARWHAGRLLDEAERRVVLVDLPGTRRPQRVPHAWIGRHLCLVVPAVSQRLDRATELGPAQLAFRALAQACRAAGTDQPFQVGARIAGSVFASTTLLVDGSWWAPLDPTGTASPHLVPLERCFVTGHDTPEPRGCEDLGVQLDRLLDARLQKGVSGSARTDFEVRGDGLDSVWPRVPVPGPRRGLAEEAVEALWNVGRRRRTPTGRQLPPLTPGGLARQWHYGPDFRPTRSS